MELVFRNTNDIDYFSDIKNEDIESQAEDQSFPALSNSADFEADYSSLTPSSEVDIANECLLSVGEENKNKTEDFQKTYEDWKAHIHRLKLNTSKDLSCSSVDFLYETDVPDQILHDPFPSISSVDNFVNESLIIDNYYSSDGAVIDPINIDINDHELLNEKNYVLDETISKEDSTTKFVKDCIVVSSVAPPKSISNTDSVHDAKCADTAVKIKKSSKRKKIPHGSDNTRSALVEDVGAPKNKISKNRYCNATQNDHNYCTESTNTGTVSHSKKTSAKRAKTTNSSNIKTTNATKSDEFDAFSITDDDIRELDKLSSTPYVENKHESPLNPFPLCNETNKEVCSTNWEKNSKKDSGLESGEVSDTSEHNGEKKTTEETSGAISPRKIEPKKKLNLEQYRFRRSKPARGSIGEVLFGHNNQNLNNSSINSGTNIKHEVRESYEPAASCDNSCDSRYSRSPFRKRSGSGHRKVRHWSSSSSNCSRSRSKSRTRLRRMRRGDGGRYKSSSRSRSSSVSSRSSSSRSRSRSRSRSSKRYRPSAETYRRRSNGSHHRDRRTPPKKNDDWSQIEKQKQFEERRVIYVGLIQDGTTKAQLRKRFESFGPITDISLHFRERGDNYGFVTFASKTDAYEAVTRGNDCPGPRYDISFGGRRAFCKQRYADLDSMGSPTSGYSSGRINPSSSLNDSRSNSFDDLLREFQEKIRKEKLI